MAITRGVTQRMDDIFLIYDDIECPRVSDDIFRLNKKSLNLEKFYVKLNFTNKGQQQMMILDKFEMVRENSVIYLPQWMSIMFGDAFNVSATIVDPTHIKEVAVIVIQPTVSNFRREITDKELAMTLLGRSIIFAYVPPAEVPHKFTIVSIYDHNGCELEYGTTVSKMARFIIRKSDEYSAKPYTTSGKLPINMQNLKGDFSHTKDLTYTRPYIVNGTIIYVK
jgi:hypothetical protein